MINPFAMPRRSGSKRSQSLPESLQPARARLFQNSWIDVGLNVNRCSVTIPTLESKKSFKLISPKCIVTSPSHGRTRGKSARPPTVDTPPMPSSNQAFDNQHRQTDHEHEHRNRHSTAPTLYRLWNVSTVEDFLCAGQGARILATQKPREDRRPANQIATTMAQMDETTRVNALPTAPTARRT